MGGSSKKMVVGYDYYASVHLVACHGPIDSLNKIFIGERRAWAGNVTANTSIYIDRPDLFGGREREGGAVGSVDIMFGEPGQVVNPYLSRELGKSGVIGNQTVYKMLITPGLLFNYTVTKTTQNNVAGGPPVTVVLISTTSQSAAEAVFVRDSSTRVETLISGQTLITTGINDGNVPAFRGVFSLLFRRFLWSSKNPYLKNPWIEGTRILKGWANDAPWYPEKAVIVGTDGVKDMNPAHMLYQALTDNTYGMGYSTADLNDAVWRAAADKLYTEGFGLSGVWSDGGLIKDFVRVILDHINGSLRLNLLNGLFELTLIRDDYVVDDLVHMTVDNVVSLESFQRSTWGETANQVIVVYTGRNEMPRSITAENLAGINIQGGVTPVTREYPFIRDPVLARRVLQRDLATISSPMAKVQLKCDRTLWNKAEGDLFRLTWEPKGIYNVAFRIIRINKGNLQNGIIEVEAVEDVFGLPESSYLGVEDDQWVDPIDEPHAAEFQKLIETPYWEVVRNVSEADLATLPPDYSFAQLFFAYGTGLASGLELMTSPNATIGNYASIGAYNYTPHAQVIFDVPMELTSTFSVASDSLLDTVEVGDYGWIGDEAFIVTALDTLNLTITADRGTLDTVPKAHPAGTDIWFPQNVSDDETIYVDGETVYYRGLTRTPIGRLDINDAVPMSITFDARAQRPYPPAGVQFNGAAYPTLIIGALTLTWAHRDRLQQTASLVNQTAGSIGPEAGTTYSWRVLRADTMAVTGSGTGITGTSAVLTSSYKGPVIVELWSVRDGLDSLQRHSIPFEWYSDARITELGEERITEAGEIRVTEN